MFEFVETNHEALRTVQEWQGGSHVVGETLAYSFRVERKPDLKLLLTFGNRRLLY